MHLAHIINPVSVTAASDLFLAQPVTFRTMQAARAFAEPDVEVDIFTAQFPEDRHIIPAQFKQTSDLDRSVLDMGSFMKPRKFPLLRDILDRLYESSDADYFIYTNVDIALMPQFYQVVNLLTQNGFDAFVINRRTIPATHTHVEHIPLMYSSIGQPHPGFDCFVFRRNAYPRFVLGDVCLGIAWVGRILLINLAVHGKRFQLIQDVHLTFHLGNEMNWRNDEFQDYQAFNAREGTRALETLDKECGPFDRTTIPGIYMTDRFRG